MAVIPRLLIPRLHDVLSWYQVVSVVGPRQSGKSTLLRSALPQYSYINLETETLRKAARLDPIGFLAGQKTPLIIDEAQLAPELSSQIQVLVDESTFARVSSGGNERSEAGSYVLSGSQNFLLQKNISQSLAGRVGYLRLLPLSFEEAVGSSTAKRAGLAELDAFAVKGGYPRLYDTGIPARSYFQNYVDTYLRRDVSGYLDVRNFSGFMTFVRLCAQSAGELLNLAYLAREAGIAYATAKSWLSILESGYIVYLLQPFSTNSRKRLTKTPKLYFLDNGLLCYLLGVSDLQTSDRMGQVFENLVVSETVKKYFNRGVEPRLSFYRDSSQVEVDLVDETSGSPRLYEVKAGQTPRDSFFRHLTSVGDDLGCDPSQRTVVYRGEMGFTTPRGNYQTAWDYFLQET